MTNPNHNQIYIPTAYCNTTGEVVDFLIKNGERNLSFLPHDMTTVRILAYSQPIGWWQLETGFVDLLPF